MRKLVQKLGLIKSILLITLFSVLVSNSVTYLIFNILGDFTTLPLALAIATTVPLIVAPISSWPIIGLLLKIDKLEKEMRDLATYDSLTGLLSRHAFFHDADNYINLAKREKKTLTVLCIDLDYFKSINDQYGHATGDSVLREFALVSKSIVRKSDIFGRIGGEEFALILPETSKDAAIVFTEKLQSVVRKSTVKNDQNAIKITMSVGLVSLIPNEKDTIGIILKKADKMLYQAKEKGRDRIEIYSEADVAY